MIDRFPVEAGHVHTFAAAIGDANPAYQVMSEEIVAPPTFAIAGAQFDPDYPLRPRIGIPWFGSGGGPSGGPARHVEPTDGLRAGDGLGPPLHAEQEFTLHRPLVPGDVLATAAQPGKRWERTGSSGRLHFVESVTEYRDQRGDLVVTSRSVTVQTQLGGAS